MSDVMLDLKRQLQDRYEDIQALKSQIKEDRLNDDIVAECQDGYHDMYNQWFDLKNKYELLERECDIMKKEKGGLRGMKTIILEASGAQVGVNCDQIIAVKAMGREMQIYTSSSTTAFSFECKQDGVISVMFGYVMEFLGMDSAKSNKFRVQECYKNILEDMELDESAEKAVEDA